MSQNGLKSIFKMMLYELKIVSRDAYQCKTWLTLLFLKWGNNCQKTQKKNVFVTHSHKAVRSRPMMLFDLIPSFAPSGKWKCSKRYITQISLLKTALLVLIIEIFKSFKSIVGSLHGALPQMWSNLFKNFSSYAAWLFLMWFKNSKKLGKKLNFWPKGFSVYILKLHNCGKFLDSICGCSVKNFESFAYWFSIHDGGFGTPASLDMIQYYQNSHQRYYSSKPKYCLKNSSFYGKWTAPKLAHLVQIWPRVSPWRWQTSKKQIGITKKRQPLGYSNMSTLKNVFKSSAISKFVFKIFTFFTKLFCSLIHDLSESDGFITFQKSLLSGTFFSSKLAW